MNRIEHKKIVDKYKIKPNIGILDAYEFFIGNKKYSRVLSYDSTKCFVVFDYVRDRTIHSSQIEEGETLDYYEEWKCIRIYNKLSYARNI